jgi:hypothetical protein
VGVSRARAARERPAHRRRRLLAQAWSSETDVSIPVPTLKTPPRRPAARSKRAHNVVDVDEVPGFVPSPKIVVGSPAASRSRKIAITPPSSAADWRGP